MKHSIKREQSHARMIFAECENVRATLKNMKQTFNLILILAVMLTMAQTAWAANEETVTWTMDGGKSGQTTLSGDYTLINTNGKEIHY